MTQELASNFPTVLLRQLVASKDPLEGRLVGAQTSPHAGAFRGQAMCLTSAISTLRIALR